MHMEKTGIYALVALILITVTVASLHIFREDIENFFAPPKVVEIGDCVDVNYIVRYASNSTIIDTSYEGVAKENGIYRENKTYQPLKIYVSLNATSFPPQGYEDYSSAFIRGVIEALIGMKEGEEKTVTVPPEKAYGIKPKIGDIINISGISFKLIKIEENATMPKGFTAMYGNGTTTIYVLRVEGLEIGKPLPDYLDPYSAFWPNSSIITKMNETKVWVYITPSTGIGENFTWMSYDQANNTAVLFPQNKSMIINLTDSTIEVQINPSVNDTILVAQGFSQTEYKVTNITDDKIIAKADNETREFDRIVVIKRNQTRDITMDFPVDFLKDLFDYIRMVNESFPYSLDKFADQTLVYDLKVVKIYKTSEES